MHIEKQQQEKLAKEQQALEEQFAKPVEDPSKFKDVTLNIRKKRT